jgi:hypothetical protein
MHSYSSADGLMWTEHTKIDWGERIINRSFVSSVRVDAGGLDYRARTFLSDMRSSLNGIPRSKIGNAELVSTRQPTVVVYVIICGCSERRSHRHDRARLLA